MRILIEIKNVSTYLIKSTFFFDVYLYIYLKITESSFSLLIKNNISKPHVVSNNNNNHLTCYFIDPDRNQYNKLVYSGQDVMYTCFICILYFS